MESDNAALSGGIAAAQAPKPKPLAKNKAKVAHLAATGHSVALSTLSQWQHGRRVPASPRSFAVVEELERRTRLLAPSVAVWPDMIDEQYARYGDEDY